MRPERKSFYPPSWTTQHLFSLLFTAGRPCSSATACGCRISMRRQARTRLLLDVDSFHSGSERALQKSALGMCIMSAVFLSLAVTIHLTETSRSMSSRWRGSSFGGKMLDASLLHAAVASLARLGERLRGWTVVYHTCLVFFSFTLVFVG